MSVIQPNTNRKQGYYATVGNPSPKVLNIPKKILKFILNLTKVIIRTNDFFLNQLYI